MPVHFKIRFDFCTYIKTKFHIDATQCLTLGSLMRVWQINKDAVECIPKRCLMVLKNLSMAQRLRPRRTR